MNASNPHRRCICTFVQGEIRHLPVLGLDQFQPARHSWLIGCHCLILQLSHGRTPGHVLCRGSATESGLIEIGAQRRRSMDRGAGICPMLRKISPHGDAPPSTAFVSSLPMLWQLSTTMPLGASDYARVLARGLHPHSAHIRGTGRVRFDDDRRRTCKHEPRRRSRRVAGRAGDRVRLSSFS